MLSPYGFKETERADANLQAMADDPMARQLLSEIIEELLFCLSRSADPDQALNYLERFTKAAVNKIRFLSYLKENPRTLELLAKIFGGSPFMSEILIRDPHYLYWVSDPEILYKNRKKRDLMRDLSIAMKYLRTEEKKLDILRIFKRKEILLIGIRDLLRISDVEGTLASLSILAEVLIQKAYETCRLSMNREHGTPFRGVSSNRKIRAGFAVIGMGKLGGGELNFSSDVDLIYVCSSDREGTSQNRSKTGSASISKAEYFKYLAQKITRGLSDVTDEGYLYRADLRLRPDGRTGNITNSLGSCRQYYASRGETWERIAMLKAWPVAGDRALGARFISMIRPFIFRRTFDGNAISEVRRIKERINQKMSDRGLGRRNVKLGSGGIREIEFIVQSLQVSFGKRFPVIHKRNTLNALSALFKKMLLSEEEYSFLSAAYIFLRDVENKLQMVYDFQIHVIFAIAPEKQKRF
jgi:glutamate-ammonia-ligase adenylyltransferase